MQMYNIILNTLSQFEIIDFLFCRASLIDNIHISLAKIVILCLVFIMILTIFIENLNWLVSNKWSISKESMYALILKGLLIQGLKIFFGFSSIRGCCPFALLPFLVGWRCNYLDFSLQVKFSTKFCSSNSGVGNALTARNYSTLPATHQYSVENYKLDPRWVTGFIDGEGCFRVSIIENKKLKVGWEVQPRFQLTLHVRDKTVLEKIKNSLRVGQIYKHGPETLQFKVISIKELKVILEHFDKYPLITQKQADYKAFKLVYFIIKNKEHLTQEGLIKIVAIKASMNLGLSEELKLAFPDVVPVVRPLVENPKIIDPNWLAGFTSAEGCFMVKITASKTKVGFQVLLVFKLTQHTRDEELIKSLIEYLECGNIYRDRNAFDFKVTKLDYIENKIIPLFKQHPIKGVKALDFADWCKVAELMQEKKHLTTAGLEQIRQIKAGMNIGRKCKCNHFL